MYLIQNCCIHFQAYTFFYSVFLLLIFWIRATTCKIMSELSGKISGAAVESVSIPVASTGCGLLWINIHKMLQQLELCGKEDILFTCKVI